MPLKIEDLEVSETVSDSDLGNVRGGAYFSSSQISGIVAGRVARPTTSLYGSLVQPSPIVTSSSVLSSPSLNLSSNLLTQSPTLGGIGGNIGSTAQLWNWNDCWANGVAGVRG